MGISSSLHYIRRVLQHCLINFHLGCFFFFHLWAHLCKLHDGLLCIAFRLKLKPQKRVWKQNCTCRILSSIQSALATIRICQQMMMYIVYLCILCMGFSSVSDEIKVKFHILLRASSLFLKLIKKSGLIYITALSKRTFSLRMEIPFRTCSNGFSILK